MEPTKQSGILKCGDHIVTPRPRYKHHGIYIGNDQVVHYARANKGTGARTIIQVSLDEFDGGYGFYVVLTHSTRFSTTQILNRARSRMGETRYHLLRNNCEHFSNWCVCGDPISAQVQRLAAIAPFAWAMLVATLISSATTISLG